MGASRLIGTSPPANLMSLHLDFIARPAPLARAAGWLLLLAAVAGAALLARHHETQRASIDGLLDRQARLQGPVVNAQSPQAAAQVQAQQQLQTRWRAVVEPLAVPWAALFGALESVPARGVVLNELVPDAQAGRLRLAGQAPDLQAALAYIDRLAAQPVLADVHLVQYAPMPDAAAGGIGFVLEATWRRS